jgi:hypothetical protein
MNNEYIKTLSLLFVLFHSGRSFSYEIMQPTLLGLDYEYYETLREAYVPEDADKWVYGAGMYTQISVLGSKKQGWKLFYDPKLMFRSTTSQIRYGALEFSTGLEINKDKKTVRVFRRHLSEHVLERQRDSRTYPLMDSYGVSIEWKLN